MAEQNDFRPSAKLYGVAIHQGIQSGDLETMRRVRDEAERWLSENGDIAAALEVLKAEIARAERKA